MSRIGRQPIPVPSGVQVNVDGQSVKVKGPKGELMHHIADSITVSLDDGTLNVARTDDDRNARSLHGLTRTLIDNMVIGVTKGYEKNLEIQGTGYRVALKGKNLEFALGFSHPVVITPPEGINFAIDGPTKITVAGIDKQLVGETAANIRKIRPPEPYKGKGIRYVGETVKRKAGKAGKK